MSVPTILIPSPKAGTGGCVGRGELVGLTVLVGLGFGVEVRVRVLVPAAASVIEGAGSNVGVEEGTLVSMLGEVLVSTAVLFETTAMDSGVFVDKGVAGAVREST